MKRVALYVRVSTDEQKKHGLSVGGQINALKEYCEANNYYIVGIYNDAGISASKKTKYTKRPALMRLIDDCNNKGIELILITKLDRFFRSVPDYYAVIEKINNVPWRAIWEDYETETSAGIFKVNIMLSIAQAEADRTSERIKATMNYKKQRGDYLGQAPLGYKVRGRDMTIDETERPGVEAFFKEYFTSYSIAKACRAAYDYGLKLNRNSMSKLIKNPAYCGETFQGYKCTPYITKEQHALILETLQKNAREPKNKHTYIFSGLCYCAECGQRMAGKSSKRTHKDGSYIYLKRYACNNYNNMQHICKGVTASEKKLEQFMLDKIESIIEEREAYVKSINAKALTYNGAKRKAELENKLKRIAELYADGDISKEDYIAKRDKTKNEINDIVIDALPVPKTLPNNWKELYSELDLEHRRSFWLSVVKAIKVSKGKVITYSVELL